MQIFRQNMKLLVKQMTDVKHLRAFLAVAEVMHLGRAAEALGIQQSTLSRQLTALEEKLGVWLFERNRSGMRLTVAGAAFLVGVRRTLFEFDRTVTFAARSGRAETGHITFGFLVSLAAGRQRELLSGFASRWTDIEMDFVEASRDELLARLVDRQIDLAFIPRFKPISGFESDILWNERFLVAMPEDHRLAAQDRIPWVDLASEPILVRAYESAIEIHAFLAAKLGDESARLRIRQLNVSRESLINLVGIRQGIAIATDAALALDYPGIVFRPIATEDEQLPISIVWMHENANPVLARFRSFARDRSKAWTSVTTS